MKLKPWTLPLLVLAGANAFPLLNVARDRIPGPVMQGTFTERELPRNWMRDENSGVALTWSWMGTNGFDSMTTAQLAEFGFDCEEDVDRCASDERTAWALVTIDDDKMEARIAEAERQHATLVAAGHADTVGWDERAELRRSASRLVIEKIGTDPDRLRADAGVGAVILPVRVTAWLASSRSDSTPRWWRVNANPMPGVLHVPAELASEFNELAPDNRFSGRGEDQHPLPRYEVVVIIGAAGLPRIEEIRPLK